MVKKLTYILSVAEKLQTFLFQYWITPPTITGKSPVELPMNRKLNNELNIKPGEDTKVYNYMINF